MRSKYVFLILLFTCVCISAIAQTYVIKPKLLWSKQLQLQNADRDPFQIVADDGSVLISAGVYHGRLVYLDPKGNIRWTYKNSSKYFGGADISSDGSKVMLTYTRTRPYGDTEYDTDRVTILNSQGRVIWDQGDDDITEFLLSGKYVLGYGGASGYPILKLYNSSNGKLLWRKSFPKSSNTYITVPSLITESGNRVLVNVDRNIYMFSTVGNKIWTYYGSATSVSTSSNGGLTAMLTGGEEWNLLILNSSGSVIKTVKHPGSNKVAVSPDGKLIIVTGGYKNSFISGYDSIGRLIWQYNPPEEYSDLNRSVRFVTNNCIEFWGNKLFLYLNRSGKLVRIMNSPFFSHWANGDISDNGQYLAGIDGHKISLHSMPAFE